MGGFAQGLGQGIQGSQQYLADIQNRRQQAELFALKSKQLKLETDMQEKQLAAQNALPEMLFKPPQQRQVTVQGPGAPQPPEDQAGLLAGYSPAELDKAGGAEGVLKQYATEGPQPTGMADIAGTGGPWAGLSPEMQAVAQNILMSTGDMGKTMGTLQNMNVFPKPPQPFDLGPDHIRFMPSPDGKSAVPIAVGRPKTSEQKMHVVNGALVDDAGRVVYQGQEKPAKEQGLMSVAPNSTVYDPVTKQPVFTAPPAQGEEAMKPVADENRIALADYGKRYVDLDRHEQQAVNAKIKQDRVDIAAATGAESAKTALAKQQLELLSPSEANELGVPYGTTREGAKGIPSITPVQRQALTKYQAARSIVADIKQYSERVNTAEPGFWGRLQQAGTLWGSWTQSNPDGAMLLAKAGELGMLVKALGESGAMSDGDMARAAGLVPHPMDTVQVAVLKLKDLEGIVNNGEAAFRASLGPGAKQALQAEQQAAPAPQAKPQGKAQPQAGKQPAQEDPRVSQMGRIGRELYADAKTDAERQEVLDNYFKSRERNGITANKKP